MQNKVIVCAENQFLICDVLRKIEKSLLKMGLFDFSFLSCSLFADCLSFCTDAKRFADTTIVVCENEKIDKIIDSIKDGTEKFSLLKEQAVVLEHTTTYNKMLFLPIEVEAESFLDLFLNKREVFCCSIFGKSKSFVENEFERLKNQNRFEFALHSKSQFLHTVYFSGKGLEEGLKDVFGESLISFDDKSLADCCVECSTKKGVTLSIAEGITKGKLVSKLAETQNFGLVVKKSFVLNKDGDFEDLNIDGLFLNENGDVSKETAFATTKNLIAKSSCDVGISILGFDCDAGRCFVAVGNKKEIHVFSSVFFGGRLQIFENACDFALFRLLKFLQHMDISV